MPAASSRPNPFALGAAFAEVIVLPDLARSGGTDPGRALVGHDGQVGSAERAAELAAGLAGRGVDVELVGPCSMDALLAAAGALEAPGAMVAAEPGSGRPAGVLLVRADGRPVEPGSGLPAVLSHALAEPAAVESAAAETPGDGTIRLRPALASYAELLRSLADLTRVRPLTVVVEAGHGVAALTVPAVLGTAVGLPALPLEIIVLSAGAAGDLGSAPAPHPSDPAHLLALRAEVVARGADLGLAFDADGDRVVVVDENGDLVSAAVVAMLVGLREVERERREGAAPTVVLDRLLSEAAGDLLTAAGAAVVRSGGGGSSLRAAMAASGAVVGASPGLHYAFRDLYLADSGLLAAMHVLATLGSGGVPLSAFAEVYQPYAQSGEMEVPVDDVAAARARVVAAYVTRAGAGPVQVDAPDGGDAAAGLTVRHWAAAPRWWFDLRPGPAGTTVRLTVEAADEDIMEKVRDDVLALVRAGDAPKTANKE
ncbi:phosphohexomutase domain-containing protein [Pengzhenrongella sicca]|uniref:Phosphomannomutase/phosphoglucomutase n=1 Tax=Pengzhenrongella sicca TaxID=2819238 RepID=A0A8A4ZFT5_9MICO|nr:phosphomannomutase/phosphoglucomutase [Pengzhenrongella sicca]QTE30261.1 phosphomannomutase/phosphoglucomutase [Pengzhenrongella sicca]